MSADNGIYIAKFTRPSDGKVHYRVSHAQAIDNIAYCFETEGDESGNEQLRIYFGRAKKFNFESDAMNYALNVLYKEVINCCGVCEYGISNLGEFEDVFDEDRSIEDISGRGLL